MKPKHSKIEIIEKKIVDPAFLASGAAPGVIGPVTTGTLDGMMFTCYGSGVWIARTDPGETFSAIANYNGIFYDKDKLHVIYGNAEELQRLYVQQDGTCTGFYVEFFKFIR